MAFASDTRELLPQSLTSDTLFRAPLGFVSPLWGLFSGAALTGVVWWWATQWTRAPLMAAAFDEAEEIPSRALLAIEAAPESVVEATADVVTPVAAVVDETAEAIVEQAAAVGEKAVAEPPISPVIDTVVAAELPKVVTGGEAAPIPPAALASVEAPPTAPKPPRASAKSTTAS